jgi:6-phosphogluconolactonase (cycloisomerase 2 family)
MDTTEIVYKTSLNEAIHVKRNGKFLYAYDKWGEPDYTISYILLNAVGTDIARFKVKEVTGL